MTLHSSTRGRRPFPALLRRALSALAALATVAAVISFAPMAANADDGSTDSAVVGSGASTPNLNAQWGQDLVFEQAGQTTTNQPVHYKLSPQGDGTVMFINTVRGECLQSLGAETDRQVVTKNCQNIIQQKFYFVPQSPTPHSVPNMNRDGQYFYIVDAATNQCVWSSNGGLNYTGDSATQTPRLKTCSQGDPGEEFRVYNEKPNPDGVYNEWQNILSLAAVYATNNCANDLLSCEVSSPNSPTPGAWYRPNDNAIANMGTLTTTSYGCGVGTTINGVAFSPTVTNNTLDNVTKSIGSQLTTTNTSQVSETLGYNVSLELMKGVKDVWGITFTNEFTWQHQSISGTAVAQTTTDSTTANVRPGDTLMSTWAGNVMTITGTWKFAENIPVLDPANHSLSWTMPATSSFPVSAANESVAHFSAVTSKQPKNCDASAASAIHPGSTPVITTADTECTGNPATPTTVTTGMTLKACPGVWDVPVGKGSSAPSFVYQWYVMGPDGTTSSPIAGATSQTFTVQPTTYSATTPNLGVSVYDQGNINRLESRPAVIAPVKVTVTPPALGDPHVVATNFVGVLDGAVTETPYTAALVSAAGSGMNVTVASGLPTGMTVSPDGVLSGTPTAPGTYEITLVDTPTDNGPTQTHTVELLVFNPPATFRTDTAFTATVGASFSEALVPTVPVGMQLAVTNGALPAGVTLDPTTGILSGAPTTSGTYEITLQDANSPSTYGQFSITVSDAAAVYSNGALPRAQVGAAYSADTVASVGTESAFALSADSVALPDGLAMNTLTGKITGVPTSAGTTTVSLVDLSNTANASSITLTVDPAGAAALPAKASALAATGFNPTGLLLTALAFVVAGLVIAAMRRRRQRH